MRLAVPETIIRSVWVLLLSAGALGRVYPYIGWILISLAVIILIDYRYKKTFLITSFVLAAYCVFGMLNSYRFGLELSPPWHDFVSLVLCFYVLIFFSDSEAVPSLSSLIVPLALVLTVSVLVGFWFGYYYYDSSFRLLGLALNPNQTALYSLSLMSLLAAFHGGSFVGGSLFVLMFLIGYFTGSDAFLVAVVVWLGAAFAFWVFHNNIVLGVILLVIFVSSIFDVFFGEYIHYYIQDAQATERITRWLYWVRLMADYPLSAIVGFGTGPYGPPFSSSFHGDMLLPVRSEIAGTEFHFSLLDFISSFGVVGLFFVVLLFSRLSGSFRLSPSFFSLLAFSSFHLTYRHPIFWLAIFFAITNIHERKVRI